MRIRITMTLSDEWSDPTNDMGITEECYIELGNVLADFGDAIEIKKVSDSTAHP